MRRKSFTLMEILIVVVFIGIISTIAISSYQAVIYRSKNKVCELNVRGLTAVVKQYALENGRMPGPTLDFTYENLAKYGAKKNMFECPLRPGQHSYIVNDLLHGYSWELLSDSESIIFEASSHSNSGLLSDLEQILFLHKDRGFANKYTHVGFKKSVGRIDDPNDSVIAVVTEP